MLILKHILNFIVTSFIVLSPAVYAQEIISINWGFSIGSTQANSVRVICDELNRMQNKYTFVLVSKPGAGGSIAANSVAANPTNSLVAMSSSFIIRPTYETENVHNLDNFQPVLVQGTGVPLLFGSSKFTSLDTAISTKNVTVGVSGLGTISHLVAFDIFRSNPSTNIIVFKSNLDAAVAAVGGHVDVAIGFVGDVQPFVDSNKLNLLGRTGSQSQIKNNPNVRQLVANYAIYASTDMPKDKVLEIHNMMAEANRKLTVIDSYKIDTVTPESLTLEQSKAWYAKERAFWKTIADKLKSK